MTFKLSNLNSNLTLTLGYLNPAFKNSAQVYKWVQATAVGNLTVSSDLILILGCMTSNLLVLELFHFVFCML